MKSAKEILNLIITNNMEDIDSPYYENGFYDGRDFEILKAIEFAQKEAVEETLKMSCRSFHDMNVYRNKIMKGV